MYPYFAIVISSVVIGFSLEKIFYIFFKKQTLGNHQNAGIIRGIYLFTPGTRVGSIVRHKFQASVEINEMVNKSNSRSIS